MSWLSKLVGGNTLKLAAVAAAGYAGSQYVWGDQITSVYDSATGKMIEGAYSSGNFAADTFNKLGVTPFSETAVGSFLSPAVEFLRPSDLGGTRALANVLGAAERGQQQRPLPSVSENRLPGAIRSDTNFQLSRANMIPIGSGGQVGSALANTNTQMYLAKQVRMMGLPSRQGLPSVTLSSASSLSSSTAGKRRSYKSMIG